MLKIPKVTVDGKPIDYSDLPARYLDDMERYLTKGILPGSFLKAVIINDLKGAILHSDSPNIFSLHEIVQWLTLHTPSGSHGSYEIMDRWARLRAGTHYGG